MTDETEGGQLYPIDGHFVDVARADRSPPNFIIEGLIPEGLTVIIGPPKDSYKSTIADAIAALVAGFPCAALPLEWKANRHGPVMIFPYEADAGEHRVTLEDGIGVVLEANESIMISLDTDTYRLDDEDAIEQMMFWLEARKPTMVILDPLANAHSLEEKDAAKMIHILAPLRKWGKDHGTAFVVVHHTRKLSEERAYRADDARGTSAIFGLCDGILVITPGKKQYELMIDAKFKRHQPWNKTIMLGVWDRKGIQGGELLREIDKMILNAVAHEYGTLSQISEHLALNEKNVGERLLKLTKNGLLVERKGRLRLTNSKILEVA